MKTFKALYNLTGKSQAFCPRWTVSSLSSSSDLVRGVHVHGHVQETRVAAREEKNVSRISHLSPRAFSHARCVSRAFLSMD